MAVGYASVEDIVNAALRSCGYPRAIADIYEGSRAANVALEIYGPVRDALLQAQDWDFSYREAALALNVAAQGVAGFANSYTYPADCLRVRHVRAAIPSPNNDPQPTRWKTFNDATLATPAKLIGTNVAGAVACYTAQITNPATWNSGFSEGLVSLLSKIFAFALRDDLNLARTRTELAGQTVALAASIGDGLSPVLPQLMARAEAAARQ